jgi:hypothetical protein
MDDENSDKQVDFDVLRYLRVDGQYLFPGEERASHVADEIAEELRALDSRVENKYGRGQAELPFDEWVIWRGLMARASELSREEQRYLWKKLVRPPRSRLGPA